MTNCEENRDFGVLFSVLSLKVYFWCIFYTKETQFVYHDRLRFFAFLGGILGGFAGTPC